MKTYSFIALLFLTLCISCGNKTSEKKTSTTSENYTTYYFIRHAEKDRSDPSERNPTLNPDGLERAERWANYFGDKKIDAVYSTNYNRTIQTATPTAEANGLEVKLYDPTNMNSPEFIQETKGKNVLVVGHSNTTPQFVNAVLEENRFKDLADDDNATLFIVTVSEDSKKVKQERVN